MNYNLSKKINEKWHNFGKIAENKFGKLQASFKITPELEQLIEDSKATGWLNLSCFEAKEEKAPQSEVKTEAKQEFEDSIPF